VIVVLKHQQRGKLASASSVKARAAAQRRQRRPLIARISSAGGKVTRQFTTLNAFAATVSPAQQAQLNQDSSVAAVVPDQVVALPQQDQSLGNALAPASPGNPSTPLSTICPGPGQPPLLEGEYLQTMHVAYNDPTIPQAANLATGKGVRVAFFADGVDVNNPDFIRPDGSHVFIDYKDFTGDGPDAPSSAAEAFGDASSIAAQGRQVYDLSTYVNPRHPLPPGCNIRVRGVAPGASLIGMKVFGEGGSFSSTIVQGLDWAVTVDHADILSESFGGSSLPDTARDIIKRFNDAAVAAGITVSQGSGDAGVTSSPSPPATDDNVIDAGATTNFRAYAQTVSYAYQFSNGTYLSDNISSIGNGGFGQDAQSVDVVSPGEADWALCTHNPAIYQDCTDYHGEPTKGLPAALQQFGGTSQSTPLTAGTAALMIEAYRNTHGGRTPSPALIKQLIQSTANDLGLPSVEQGAGEVDALKAVQAAMSVDRGRPTGHSLQLSPAKVTLTDEAGSRADQNITVTNTGATTQTVSARGRDLGPSFADQRVDVTLGTAPTFTDQFGVHRPYTTAHFFVPQGADRLAAYIAWPGPNARVGMTLIDPNGSYAAFTRPQGNGNHGQVDVRDPVAGTWTAIVFLRDGTFTGPVHLEFNAQRFVGADDVFPSAMTLRPGQSGQFHLRTSLPRNPGDDSHDLVISDSSGDQTVVPVVLRSLVPVDRHGGTFNGTILGGNGRGFSAQQNTFAFDVPARQDAVSVSLAFPDNAGTEVWGTLIDPNGDAVGSGSTAFASWNSDTTVLTHGLRAMALDPSPGRWKFVVNVITPTGGTTLASPYTGRISFEEADVHVHGLPDGDRVRAGRPITATLTVRNDGPGSEDVFADARTNQSDILPLFAITPTTVPLPGTNVSAWIVPTQTTQVFSAAQATAPILLEMDYAILGEGDPSILGASSGNGASAAYASNPVGNGIWILAPSLRGPFAGPVAAAAAQTGMAARTRTFDTGVSSSTGDWWRVVTEAAPPDYTPLTLGPGQSGQITVTFTPQGRRGSKTSGVLYVDDFGLRTLTGNEQFAIPYSYRIR
jgi:hypothetical protein